MQLKNFLARKPRRGCKNAILPTELSPFLDCNATKVHHIGFFFLIVTLTD
jgi:hypothetical protein